MVDQDLFGDFSLHHSGQSTHTHLGHDIGREEATHYGVRKPSLHGEMGVLLDEPHILIHHLHNLLLCQILRGELPPQFRSLWLFAVDLEKVTHRAGHVDDPGQNHTSSTIV